MKTMRWIEKLFLLAGLAAIGVWAGSIAMTTLWQGWENRVFERRVQEQARQDKPVVASPVPARSAAPAPKPAPKSDGLVGRLSIPRLRVSAIVREGTDDDVLGVAIGHIPGTALPGQIGNIAVAGHRDTLFRGLRDVRKNDLIRLETVGGSYDYRVGSTEIVKPGDVSVLKAGSSAELTLVTCYPFNYIGAAPERFIVKAYQVTQGEPADAPPLSRLTEVSNNISPARRAEDDAVRPVPAKPTVTPAVKPAGKKIPFSITRNHSRQLVAGISIGLTTTDAPDHRVNGWMWLMPDRRTIWLKNQKAHDPIVFYGGPDGKRHELQITAVDRDSMTGYLTVPPTE